MWAPQPGPQLAALEADFCDDLFFGGERGGGKSDFQLGFQEEGALRYGEHFRGIMFRKTTPELEELQGRAVELFPKSGAEYKVQPSSGYPFSNCWYWPNGATVKMRFIEHERDYGRYHGHQYQRISIDEATEYPTPDGLLKMMSTLRSAHGVPCLIRLTGNPGGPGHAWVKARYVDPAPPMTPFVDPDTGMTRMFIPSRLEDNMALRRSDPTYRLRLLAATDGNEELRKAWLEGSWDIVAGGAFEKFDRRVHVIEPFEIPGHWTRFMSMDWGSAKPFSIGWWAVSDGNDPRFPYESIIRTHEWYGWNGKPDQGLRMEIEEVAEGILKIEQDAGIKVAYRVADGSIFDKDGGPSHAQRFARKGVVFGHRKWLKGGMKDRKLGYQEVRSRMAVDEDTGKPMLFVFSTCTDGFLRTVPFITLNPLDPTDVNTKTEDHCYDETRYACRSRPYATSQPQPHPAKPDSWDRAFARMEAESQNWKVA